MAKKSQSKLAVAWKTLMQFVRPIPKWVEWLVAVLLFVFTVAGFLAFLIRPPEIGTFNARFATDTKLYIREIQNECTEETEAGQNPILTNVIKGNVTGVAVPKPFVRPVSLILPMEPQEFEKLAGAFGKECKQCKSIDASIGKLELTFDQPLSVSIIGKGVGEYSIIRSEDVTSSITVAGSGVDAESSQEPLLELQVTGAVVSMTVKADGIKPSKFSLHPGSGMTSTLRLLAVTPWRQVNSTIQLLYPNKEIDFEGAICAKQIELEDTPEGILTLGPQVEKVGWGERLRLTVDRILPIRVAKDRIMLDARHCQNTGIPRLPWALGQEPCLVGALRNDVMELLPLWFNLWYEWMRGIWSAVAVGFISAAFLGILRHLKLWPQF